ncbi:hypothetical protein JDV09_18140 [Mycobacterium sp. Y57]|uniref:hypothetical protein n=1 Tax=Mycolicibacterium xanthum TaxID=2796469 RepID=UPI001C84137B|nr:hypothetical protein [Mycolicibacterium xanthum]MBX7434018.1 hypothetical protein [Mycolicibacterium xanthum]
MSLDQFCTSDDWSPLTSAASHSQLAGVLGGFLITAIALLFDRNSRESVHTLALFASAVLILMLDSFLFSLLTGMQVPGDSDARAVCAIGWTQSALSTGMLAAGSTALFGGLGWMLAAHAVGRAGDVDPDDVRAFSFLADLGGWLTFAAAMTATLILSETTIDYLRFMYDDGPDLWLIILIMGSACIAVVIDFILVQQRTRDLRHSLANTEEMTRLALRSIKVATVGLAVLAVVSSWLALSLARFPREWMTDPNTGMVVVVAVLTFVVPTFVGIGICYSVASTGRPEPAGRPA